nr:hypothetical protein 13 [bacterium]
MATNPAIAGASDWIHNKRFGAGNWTWHEMNSLQMNNLKKGSHNLCNIPSKSGGFTCPTDDASLAKMYKDVQLHKQLNAAFNEAYKERMKHNKKRGNGVDGNGIRTFEGMTDQQYALFLKEKQGRERIASMGIPSTLHGKHAKSVDSEVEYMQTKRLCGHSSGRANSLGYADELTPCDSTFDGSAMVVKENSVTYKDGDGRREESVVRSFGEGGGNFSRNITRNEGDVYNIENQDDGVVNVHARGSEINANVAEQE